MPEGRTTTLTARQAREVEYHRDRAAQYAPGVVDTLVPTAIARDAARRPWNAYWTLYDRLLAWGVAGRRVLVPGCGFGDDAIVLSLMGAAVSANDISPESLDIALRRAARQGAALDARVMPAECLEYPDDHFDAVVFIDILHHVDIPAAMAEVRRVLRPGAMVFGDELYTHSWMQAVRESRPVTRVLYPLMQSFIYGTDKPYITPDEHKIDEAELRVVLDHLAAPDVTWFNAVVGRVIPNRWLRVAQIDRAAMRAVGNGGRYLAGRVVFSGTLRKDRMGQPTGR